MNKDNILAVADAIEQHSIPRLGFNMALFYAKRADGDRDNSGHNCGTVACIAGWAYTVKRGRMSRQPERAERDAYKVARDYFVLPDKEASTLFYPSYEMRHEITPSQASTVLRHLAATGEVDWSIASAQHEGNGETGERI